MSFWNSAIARAREAALLSCRGEGEARIAAISQEGRVKKKKKKLCREKILKTISLSCGIRSRLTGSGRVYSRIYENYDSATNLSR